MTRRVNLSEAVGGGLAVSGDLRIETANEVRKALKVYLEGRAEMVLDLGQVDECDTAGLQLLLAARKSAAALGKPFRLTAVSAAVRETSEALGLALEGESNRAA